MLTPDALAELMASDIPHAVLDVRERGAYERGHVFRATSLPRRQLEFRMSTLVTAPATPLALIDADGALAPLAATTLAAMGYRDVRVLAGGLGAWRAAGRRVVQGLNVPSKVFGERALHEWRTPQITPEDLVRRIEKREDMVIVDSRTYEEYQRGCIPGAINVQGGELVFRFGELVERPVTNIVEDVAGHVAGSIWAPGGQAVQATDDYFAVRRASFVFICDGVVRATLTAAWFARMGVPDVAVLAGGVPAWQDAGGLIENGQP